MVKLIGDIIITGTIDDITFYQMEGKGYARRKSSLTGKKVKRDPLFTRTMESAHRLGRGSQLASKVYRSLPREEQVYALFKELKSIAIRAIKEGKNDAEVMPLLKKRIGKANRINKPEPEIQQSITKAQIQPNYAYSRLLRVHGRKREQAKRQYPKARQGKKLPKPQLRSSQRTYIQRE